MSARPGSPPTMRPSALPPPPPASYEQARRQGQVDGCWTVGDLARLLGVERRWVQWQITAGRIPVRKHPLTNHHLIADDPHLIARLRIQVAAHHRS